jgi:hypothetical protein
MHLYQVWSVQTGTKSSIAVPIGRASLQRMKCRRIWAIMENGGLHHTSMLCHKWSMQLSMDDQNRRVWELRPCASAHAVMDTGPHSLSKLRKCMVCNIQSSKSLLRDGSWWYHFCRRVPKPTPPLDKQSAMTLAGASFSSIINRGNLLSLRSNEQRLRYVVHHNQEHLTLHRQPSQHLGAPNCTFGFCHRFRSILSGTILVGPPTAFFFLWLSCLVFAVPIPLVKLNLNRKSHIFIHGVRGIVC